MAVGASKPWTEVLKIATQGQSSKLDARPLMEYFEPLTNWLKEQNKNEQSVGWVSLPEDIGMLPLYFQLLPSMVGIKNSKNWSEENFVPDKYLDS